MMSSAEPLASLRLVAEVEACASGRSRPPRSRPRVTAISLLGLLAFLSGGIAGAARDDYHECLVEPYAVVAIGSPVRGILATVLVDRSDPVVSGQPLAELESALEKASVEHAAARAAMTSEIAARQADLELARLDLARVEQMHAQKLVPAQQRDEARARHRVSSAALVQARENRELLVLELERARLQLDQRTLRSPVDGVVVERHARPGEFVYDNPVMTIARLDPLRVEVVLPARLFGTIRRGDVAEVFPELDADSPTLAMVDVVDPLLDTSSGTFGVRLVLPNADLAVPAGQRCQIAFGVVANDAAEAVELAGDTD